MIEQLRSVVLYHIKCHWRWYPCTPSKFLHIPFCIFKWHFNTCISEIFSHWCIYHQSFNIHRIWIKKIQNVTDYFYSRWSILAAGQEFENKNKNLWKKEVRIACFASLLINLVVFLQNLQVKKISQWFPSKNLRKFVEHKIE